MIYEFNGYKPVIHKSSFVHELAAITGNVIIGKDVYVGPGAAVRGDWGEIIINDVIRKKINFNCILISDDISMKALKYNLEKNALKALSAGCNLVLHCNGKMGEMIRLSKVIPKIDKFTQKKTSHFYKFLG